MAPRDQSVLLASALDKRVNGLAEDPVNERVLCADQSSIPPGLTPLAVQITQTHPVIPSLHGDTPLGVVIVGVKIEGARQSHPTDVQHVSAQGAVGIKFMPLSLPAFHQEVRV